MNSLKILIATGNKGKLKEISNLLSEINIGAIGTSDYDLPEPEEDGQDFEQNSLIKAKYYADKTNLISLADDSGLCVDLLDGKPGIYSARWAMEEIIDEKTGVKVKKQNFNLAFAKIAEELRRKNINIADNQVKAHFICNLTIFNPKTRKHFSFEGRIDGTLTTPAKGENGFGYDPIFIANILKNKTFGEISIEEKEKISHRSVAFLKFKNFLKSPQGLEFFK